jgi:hypothetical protein
MDRFFFISVMSMSLFHRIKIVKYECAINLSFDIEQLIFKIVYVYTVKCA